MCVIELWFWLGTGGEQGDAAAARAAGWHGVGVGRRRHGRRRYGGRRTYQLAQSLLRFHHYSKSVIIFILIIIIIILDLIGIFIYLFSIYRVTSYRYRCLFSVDP